jgi:surfactin synthase thioesterase subunit
MLIGHSLGGKVALEYLKVLRDAQRPVPRTTWVLDSMPSVVHGDPHTARQTIDTLKKLPQVSQAFKSTVDFWS